MRPHHKSDSLHQMTQFDSWRQFQVCLPLFDINSRLVHSFNLHSTSVQSDRRTECLSAQCDTLCLNIAFCMLHSCGTCQDNKSQSLVLPIPYWALFCEDFMQAKAVRPSDRRKAETEGAKMEKCQECQDCQRALCNPVVKCTYAYQMI